jgi:hypothetical protein
MRSIGIVDVDSHNFPNLALMKASAFHKAKGDSVEFSKAGVFDKVYASKLFNFSPDVDWAEIQSPEILKGGTGYSLANKLPIEVEKCDPDYSIYPQYDFSIQFYSRGCIRNCPFCVVREKEGRIQTVEPMALNPKGNRIEVLDNNFFANPEWWYAIADLMKQKQPVNFHGVDVRLMNEEQAYWLNKLKHHKQIHIAWDNPKDDILPHLTEMLKYIKAYRISCYVLIGYWSTPEQDLYRVEKLRELKIDPFVMPFDKSDPYQKRFARWVNAKPIFKTTKWEDYNPSIRNPKC